MGKLIPIVMDGTVIANVDEDDWCAGYDPLPPATEPICDHGFIGPCAECDGAGQMTEYSQRGES